MQDKVVLITGGDSGIGLATTRAMAKTGPTIIMASVDPRRAHPICESIKQDSGNDKIAVLEIDLASFASIHKFSEQVLATYGRLDRLINNAGVFQIKREESTDGFEMTMAVNYFGPFLLTHLLLPLIMQTADSRIINVASGAYTQGKIDFNNLQLAKGYFSFKAYAASKMAMVLFTQELAERLAKSGTTVNALNPGDTDSPMWHFDIWYWELFGKIMRRFFQTPEEAAVNHMYVATAPELATVSGKYFDRSTETAVIPYAQNRERQKALWDVSEQLTGLNGMASL